MDKEEYGFWRSLGWREWTVVALTPIAAVVVAAILSPEFREFIASSATAAWVQALGSIGAIIGAYHLGERQYKRDRDERIQMDIGRQTEALNRAMAAADLARNRVGFLDIQMRGQPPEIRKDRLADVHDCVGVMKESLVDIKYLPGVWARGTQAAQSLRKVFELAQEADTEPNDGKDAAVNLALQQAGHFLDSSIELDQILRAEISAVSQKSMP